MSWKIEFFDEVYDDYEKLNKAQINQVNNAISRVAINPLPKNEGGYGKPLGKVRNIDLTGCFKIKLKKAGIRVVYQLVRTETEMTIIVIGARRDDEVYDEAYKRLNKNWGCSKT